MILDTNAISDWWDNEPSLITILGTATRLYVPVPALAELHFGVLQSRKRSEMLEWMTQALSSIDILNVDEKTTRHYAELRLALKQNGTPIPMNDLWIAAIARQHRLPLLSRDTHFELVPDLTRISW